MKIKALHKWSVDTKKAKELQKKLQKKIQLKSFNKKIKTVAGCDVSFSRGSNIVYASIVILNYPGMEIIEEQFARDNATFPYIPGYLSFREIPVLIKAFKLIKRAPDIVLCDGQGLAHPRLFGLACHLGLMLDTPAIGCAKSHLVGEFKEPGHTKGNYSSIRYKGKKVGIVLRSRTNVKPIFISPGHKIDIKSSYRITMDCSGKYRIPVPTRLAHIAVNKYRMISIG
jgi:deoxyribonuclease V